MKVRSISRVAAAGFAAVVATGLVAAPAGADPSPVTEYRTLAGVGSDTTQDVMNGLGNVITSGGNKVIASWDARGTNNVKTRAANCDFPRPNGSSNGRRALRAAEGEDIGQGGPGFWSNTNVVNCVDFARSSSYGGGSVPSSTGNYTYISFGVDAVTLARNVNGDLPVNVSFAQVQRVYRCFDRNIAGNPVSPVMLQSGSGTWDFWSSKVGITEVEINLGDYPCLAADTDSNPATPAVPVIARAQEHDGTVLDGFPTRVVPFSAGQFIAQGNATKIASLTGVTVADRRGEAALNGIRPTGGTLQQPVVGGVLNINFPLRRDVYNIVPTADLTQPLIQSTFVGAGSAVCSATVNDGGTARKVVELFGFGIRPTLVSPLEANCGYTNLRFAN
ncbi:hypothetical protein K7640_08805 [Micromonospora sp. PLK6-60]|uniref:hypothetical protein n=1 Tax=Micromonospora sp. PLK6-60 TaxID=2873383 RepID=UPI001CA76E8C|nr:hypothetical protein [Micromonospora sp. PLK6-60]MBY8871939.1 hypothetical protein [Micromonospora sp. PLK6-60]